MKKIAVYLFFFISMISLGNVKDPFKDEKFDSAYKNIKEIFPGDFRCRFIIKQVLLRSFHEDNKNTEMIDNFNSSLVPIKVTTQYYAKYCTIPEKKWLDYFASPSLTKYFDSLKGK